MINAINATGSSNSVWDVLTSVVKQTGGQGVAALLIMAAFLIFAVILLVYYVGRLVTLYLGAVLSPVVLLLWLVPGFRDFSESAAKVYLTTVFVLFVHVVILELAASLFVGLAAGSPTQTPDTLMAMVVGLSTLIALLKTQGVMMQMSYASIGPRSARKLGGQFMTGVSFLSSQGKSVVNTVNNRRENTKYSKGKSGKGSKRPTNADSNYTQPTSQSGRSYKEAGYTASSPDQSRSSTSKQQMAKTGETTAAPKPIKSKKMEKS
jgi:type IV secretory pathway TrbL component